MVGGHSSGNIDGLGDFVRIYLRGICNNPPPRLWPTRIICSIQKHPKSLLQHDRPAGQVTVTHIMVANKLFPDIYLGKT
jgi:hypothetical protein